MKARDSKGSVQLQNDLHQLSKVDAFHGHRHLFAHTILP